MHELYNGRIHTQIKLLAFLVVESGNAIRKYNPKYAIHEILTPISSEKSNDIRHRDKIRHCNMYV